MGNALLTSQASSRVQSSGCCQRKTNTFFDPSVQCAQPPPFQTRAKQQATALWGVQLWNICRFLACITWNTSRGLPKEFPLNMDGFLDGFPMLSVVLMSDNRGLPSGIPLHVICCFLQMRTRDWRFEHSRHQSPSSMPACQAQCSQSPAPAGLECRVGCPLTLDALKDSRKSLVDISPDF